MNMVKDVLIVAKQNSIGLKMAERLETLLKDKTNVHFDLSTALRFRKRGIPIKKFDGDFIITVGGDGTLLRAAHQTNLPFLPVKIEGHGFLTTGTFHDLEHNLEKIIKGEYQIMERNRLMCTRLSKKRLLDKIRQKTYPPALNEVAFTRRRPSKVLEIEMNVDDTLFTFAGDGVMISTPTGSTAYGSSAGGPLIDPILDVVSVIPLYPFYSKIKPMIIPSNKPIEITVKGDCALVIDGHGGDYIKAESRFLVEKGEPIKLIKIKDHGFYEKFKNEFM